MPGKARIPVIIAVTAAVLLGGATTAQAAPPPEGKSVPPIKCTSEFLNNPDYRKEGWVAAKVAKVDDVFLGCGDEISGVVHIASSRSNGTTHPVFASTQGAFVQCFGRLVREGKQSPDKDFPDTRDRYELVFGVPGDVIPARATLIVDRKARFVWAMFTSNTERTPRGNNWAGCSGQTAVA
jgi:hypothetical protein